MRASGIVVVNQSLNGCHLYDLGGLFLNGCVLLFGVSSLLFESDKQLLVLCLVNALLVVVTLGEPEQQHFQLHDLSSGALFCFPLPCCASSSLEEFVEA
jgi:hypothetical protein